jgi:hypothetical protein
LPYRPVSKTDRRFGRADVQHPKSRIFPPWLGFALIISILSGRGNAHGYNCSLYPRRD